MHDPAAFIRANTELGRATLVPEIDLHLASDSHRIFQTAEGLERSPDQRFPPYWAFAWPGGQAMARYILDNPALFAGRRVVDIGSGSGVGAIAAIMSGAVQVIAADIDPMAEIAIAMNAAANGLAGRIETTTRDLLSELPDADLIIVSDLVYEPELALRVGAFLEMAAEAEMALLMGDRLSGRRPAAVLDELARYPAPLVPALIEDDPEEGRVWRVRSRASRRRVRPGIAVQ